MWQQVNRRYHPELTVPLQFPVGGQYAWYLPPASGALERQLNAWLRGYRQSGELARTLYRHYGDLQAYDYVDTRRFMRRIKQRLPEVQAVVRGGRTSAWL